jgi:hypothetical protein
MDEGSADLSSATLIETGDGMYIWDCAAFLSPHLIAYLSERPQPLKAIAISHPHVRLQRHKVICY